MKHLFLPDVACKLATNFVFVLTRKRLKKCRLGWKSLKIYNKFRHLAEVTYENSEGKFINSCFTNFYPTSQNFSGVIKSKSWIRNSFRKRTKNILGKFLNQEINKNNYAIEYKVTLVSIDKVQNTQIYLFKNLFPEYRSWTQFRWWPSRV